MKNLCLGLTLSLFLGSSLQSDVQYRLLGTMKLTSPAFISVEKFGSQPECMVISSFGAFSSGSVSVVPDIAKYVTEKKFDSVQEVKLPGSYEWPNKVDPVPKEVFGGSLFGVAVPDGFLVPGKSNGGIYIIASAQDTLENAKSYKITTEKSGFFYHMGMWVDINNDGRLDYVTARTNGKAGKGELIWLEHPEAGLQTLPWTEHLITASPDVMFDMAPYGKGWVVFAASFFDKKLVAFEVEKGTGNLLQTKVIDDKIGAAYSVKYIDINGDGVKELLVNNHEKDKDDAPSAVFVYTVPSDLLAGDYSKKVIASGFKNAHSLFVPNMSPGFPYPVYPSGAAKDAHMLIAGDGDQSAHLLRPDGKGGYTQELIKNEGGTVGSITFADLDKDGWVEFFVPNYDKGYVEVYQFYGAAEADTKQDTVEFLQ